MLSILLLDELTDLSKDVTFPTIKSLFFELSLITVSKLELNDSILLMIF